MTLNKVQGERFRNQRLVRALREATFRSATRQLSFESKTVAMIRKLKSVEYRLHSHKKDTKTKKRRSLDTFEILEAAKKHEQEVYYFKWH